VGCIILLALLKGSYSKRFEEFIKLPFSKNYFIAKGKTEEIKHPFNLLLFGIQILSVSLFLYLFFSKETKSNPLLFIQILTGVLVFTIVKISIEKIIGSIFSINKIIDQYVYEKLTYRNFLAVILLIINFIFYFSVNPSTDTLIVFASVLGILNIIIIFSSLKNHRSLLYSNFFYFLLYLCTLEISPYFILYKALID
jgi:hypothetical protein